MGLDSRVVTNNVSKREGGRETRSHIIIIAAASAMEQSRQFADVTIPTKTFVAQVLPMTSKK